MPKKYIDANKKLHIQVYDDMYEEFVTVEKTIAECLDCYTDEGCPEAADVEEVKHGEWIRKNDSWDDKAFCSECGKGRADCWFGNGIHYRIGREDANFCPVCGARMR